MTTRKPPTPEATASLSQNLSVPFLPKPEHLSKLVFAVRGEKVMLDTDLANLYGVEVRALNQAVTRNRERFPEDFMFQLTAEEWAAMRSQVVTSSDQKNGNSSQIVMSSSKHRGLAYRP